MERMINTGVHGVIDYMSAVALVVAPWLFEFQAQAGATMLSLASGIAVTAMSICTRYEGGIIKVLPMRNTPLVRRGHWVGMDRIALVAGRRRWGQKFPDSYGNNLIDGGSCHRTRARAKERRMT
jgi:hypothetical protein